MTPELPLTDKKDSKYERGLARLITGPEIEGILYAIANELAEANKTLKKIEENTRPL